MTLVLPPRSLLSGWEGYIYIFPLWFPSSYSLEEEEIVTGDTAKLDKDFSQMIYSSYINSDQYYLKDQS